MTTMSSPTSARTSGTIARGDSAVQAPQDVAEHQTQRLIAYRDDGAIAEAIGRLCRGIFPPLPLTLIAAAAMIGLLITGPTAWPALAAAAVMVVFIGATAGNRHGGRLDWLVPPLLGVTEYIYLAVIGLEGNAPDGLVYLLIVVVAYHHYDTVYRTRQSLWPKKWVFFAGLGWEGRILLAALALLAGQLPVVYIALVVYLALLFGTESIVGWVSTIPKRAE